MTTAPHAPTRTRIDPDASDDELVLATRAGDSRAYGVLWDRHAPAAKRAARAITNSIDPEDLVSEAFAKTFSAIRNGGGPTDAFRPYLFAAVRSAAATWGGKQKDIPLEYIDDLPVDDSEDSLDLLSDKSLLSTAFKDLPERWRTLLWYLEVEGMKPREIAPLMGMTPNAVSVLAARAREGFKIAWLHAHIKEPGRDEECRWACERIVAQERKRHVPRADRARFDAHLDGCRRCTMASAEVAQASSKLRAVLLPVLLGGPAAAAYSAGSPAPAGAAVDPVGTVTRWGVVVGGVILVGTLAVGVVAVAAQLAGQGAPGVEDPPSALVVESPSPIVTPVAEPAPVAEPQPVAEPTPVPPPLIPATEDPPASDLLTDLLTVPGVPSVPVRPSIPPTSDPTDPVIPKPLDRVVTVVWEVTDASAVPPAITGTATPGAQIDILDEGGAVIATTTADGAGAFSVSLDPDTLRQGMSIAARQTSPTTGAQTTSDAVGPLDFAVPTVVDSGTNTSRVDADGDGAEDDVELTLQGIEGATVSVAIDGAPPTEALLTTGSTVVGLLDVPLGSHDVVVRYLDPATGALGLAQRQRIVVVP